MSKIMASKIKKWYPYLWKLDQVRNALEKKVITKEEYKDITGMDYDILSKDNTDDTFNEVSSNNKEE